jgi:hypothetical protein
MKLVMAGGSRIAADEEFGYWVQTLKYKPVDDDCHKNFLLCRQAEIKTSITQDQIATVHGNCM